MPLDFFFFFIEPLRRLGETARRGRQPTAPVSSATSAVTSAAGARDVDNVTKYLMIFFMALAPIDAVILRTPA
jgi:hypothetical protein